jgi:hypothetical protein
LIVVSLGLFIPGVFSLQHDVLGQNDIDALVWLKNNTDEQSIVLALPEEGSALSYISGRKNVMDDNYIMIKNIDTRYEDVNSIYSDKFITTALEKLNYYSVDYIFLSEYNQKKNNISNLAFFDESCFKLVYPEKYTDEFIDSNLDKLSMDESAIDNVTENSENSNGNINESSDNLAVDVSNNYLFEDVSSELVPKIYKVKCKLEFKSKGGLIR